jgi:hypothetical protein
MWWCNEMLAWKVFGSGLPGLSVQAIGQDTNAAVSAAGTTQGTATELAAADNDVTTVAANSGVVLSSKFSPGDVQWVLNSGANPLNVYPPSGMKINQLAANGPVIIQINTAAMFKCISTSKVVGVLSA